MENLINFIRAEFLIVALGLYFVGVLLKKSKLKDNWIPIILGGIGVITCTVYLSFLNGLCYQSFLTGIVQGLLCGASSTYVNQIIKQMKKLGVNDEVADIAEAVTEKKE